MITLISIQYVGQATWNGPFPSLVTHLNIRCRTLQQLLHISNSSFTQYIAYKSILIHNYNKLPNITRFNTNWTIEAQNKI